MSAERDVKLVEFARPLDDDDLPKVVTTLRFDATLLKLLDEAAKKRGISRTAYVMIAVSRAVEKGL